LIDKLIWYFLIYAMIGYVVEVLYCSTFERKLVNRGFLSGPWLPIYGIGALLILIGTFKISFNFILVFIVTVVLTSLVEYIGSWMLEKFFGIQLWDYSTYPFNIKGRICLRNSFLFGLLGLALVYGIHPFVADFVGKVSEKTLSSGSHIIILVIGIDSTKSIMSMLSFTRLLELYQKRKVEIEERLATLDSTSHARLLIERLKEERKELLDNLTKQAHSIMKRFPSLKSRNVERQSHLRVLRERIKERQKKK
jgi:uncharacterized membrane protein